MTNINTELHFCESNINLNSNFVKRVKTNILYIPFETLINYFFWNYENIYFLILSLFQLSTLFLIPKTWSPTGPYSTAIPLLLCISIEIITKMIKWYQDWNLDYIENNTEYKCVNPNNIQYKKKNADIYPGDVIYLQKETICPIDGILLDTTNNEKHSKISLSLLTGESNIHYVIKPNKYFKLNNYEKSKLIITNYHSNNFHNIEGNIITSDSTYKIKGDNFIVSGSIIKSDDVYVWVIGCGINKKSYLKKSMKNDRKKNRIDNFIGKYMINVNAILLSILIFLTTTIKLITIGFSMYNLIFFSIQNLILFNGLIPFSIKILLILARYMQSMLNNKINTNITINNPSQIDDIGKINKILTDKTGTITKNELEFSNILEIWKNNIINVSTFDHNKCNLSIEFHKCLGLCIHQAENGYATPEDQTIRFRYHQLNNRINQIENIISLCINDNKYDYKYVDICGLDFTFERKLSSKIVKDANNKYFIYCKGSLDIIMNKIITKHKNELSRLDKLISSVHPELRLLACAYREIDIIELNNAIDTSIDRSAMIQALENNLELLGIIGIKDNLQPGVIDTINKCKTFGLETSLLTGDRKITAMAISKEAEIITYKNIIHDYSIYDINVQNGSNNISDISNTTLIFSGSLFETLCKINESNNLFFDQLLLPEILAV